MGQKVTKTKKTKINNSSVKAQDNGSENNVEEINVSFKFAHHFYDESDGGLLKKRCFMKEKQLLCKYVYENIIGVNAVIDSPYGPTKTIYCDYIASGRSLKFIEQFIQDHVLALYANTHSESSTCARQTTAFREEARALIKSYVNAKENDLLIFVGSGCTGAIHKLVNALDLRDDNVKNTVILVSAFEHHSNILPWKETGVEVLRMGTDSNGLLDIQDLENHLDKYRSLNKNIICSLNAASNVTGIMTETDRVSELVHRYGGYIFWDYATAAPYLKIDMNPSETSYKDAVFLSAHKFLGGPGSPGILLAKAHLFKNPVPGSPGGGTVIAVTRSTHVYMNDIEMREEGGTPDIIGSIRAGLVFQLKNAFGEKFLESREKELVKAFYDKLAMNKNLIILGNTKVDRLPVFSFLVRHHETNYLIHHNFVGLLLNDLFGIQCRTGCACAGPYTQDLLNIDDRVALKFASYQTEYSCDQNKDKECYVCHKTFGIVKPGFTRLNLPYFFDDHAINEVLDAIEFICNYGWFFLPQYTFDIFTGYWRHRFYPTNCDTLQTIHYTDAMMNFDVIKIPSLENTPLLTRAYKRLEEAKILVNNIDFTADPKVELSHTGEVTRWFMLPEEAAHLISCPDSVYQYQHVDPFSIFQV